MPFSTAGVSLAVTPTVVSTLLSHYLNRKPLKQRPTAHLSYDEGLHLIRSFLQYSSHHTVEELQAFTAQWVPHPRWVKVDDVTIPEDQLVHAAAVLEEQLGPEGVRQIGGRKWWQWRRPNSPLKGEWIEMRADYNARKKKEDAGRRVMLYVHGGAYYFGSVDEHRYQLQRHARKLNARILAPEYRLAPQFPFPCGLQDCLATYLHLITTQEPNTIILAGDSAGGGMIVSLLVILRDRGIPLPAGAILISPWVDLTHSFPSVAGHSQFDYIPASGFHHKPSSAWPPPSEEELETLKKQALEEKAKKSNASNGHTVAEPETAPTIDDIANQTTKLSITLNGEHVTIQEQIQMYTTNELLAHPLVSPIMQPTLGGLPPLLIMVGGGELLRDEQIYLAHKCANPSKYTPREELLTDSARAQIARYKPTDVQLQVWDDLCHVAPTLSFTRPAKHMYRSVAQFGAWALARAQKTEIDILDDDQISVITSGSSDTDHSEDDDQVDGVVHPATPQPPIPIASKEHVGKAGDPLPRFEDHMIRQRVTRHGGVTKLDPAADLPGCNLSRDQIGVIKEGPVSKWMETKKQWDSRFASTKQRVLKKRLRDMVTGYEDFGAGEFPPQCALASRRKTTKDVREHKRTKSMGLSLWSLWGSKHDEMTVEREHGADKEPETKTATAAEGQGARSFKDIKRQGTLKADFLANRNRSRSHRRVVVDESQTNDDSLVDENTPIAILLERQATTDDCAEPEAEGGTLEDGPPVGVTGKRPFIGGIASPFSIKKEPDTASMMTLMSSNTEQGAMRPPSALSISTHLEEDGKGPECVQGVQNAAMENAVQSGRRAEVNE